MALVNMNLMLEDACREGYAIGNFDCINVEMVKGVINAAQSNKAPVIIAYGEVFEELIPIEEFAELVKSCAKRSCVPVAIHLDHANNFQIILRALKSGFTSIMVDASDKELEENIAITNKAGEICRAFDASLEAELGHVGGLEGQYEAADYDENASYTVVEEAVRFVKETGVDALAVAIGTVHGVYKSEPQLSIKRLREIKAKLSMPLVLHGSSGLSDADLQECVKHGINKFNVFTDLAIAAVETTKRDVSLEAGYLEKCKNVADAVGEVALDRMKVFGSVGKAK